MADPIIGEIRLFAGLYAPANWHLCDGTLLSINDYQALYALIGTTYGGDGATTFGVPDFRGRLPVGQGAGPNLTPRTIGQSFGTETVTINEAQLPAHNHTWLASSSVANLNTPVGNLIAATAGEQFFDTVTDPTKITPLQDTACGDSGGGQSHNNVMPSFAMNYIICLNGIFPARN